MLTLIETLTASREDNIFRLLGQMSAKKLADKLCCAQENRNHFIHNYAWAIPSEDAILTIARYSPHGVVDMGAGLGLWSRLLHQHKVKTTAYDEAPPHKRKFNPWIPKQRTYFPVWKGGPRKLLKYSRETLLLVWPPYKESFAWECLKYHRGEFVAFVGEGWGGCTGDDEFFGELSTNYRLVERIPIPQWPGINDELFIYRTSKY